MWPNTRITELFGIKYPILLGPMGGGFSTVDLLAEVSNAGGLGSFGAATLSPEQILEVGRETKAKTDKPYNINLFVSDVDDNLKTYPPESVVKVKASFKPYFDELGVPIPEIPKNIESKFEKQFEAILQIKPAVISFTYGIPSKDILDKCRQAGIKIIGVATTLAEALAWEEAQVDAIVASGSEAGGHKVSFLGSPIDSLTGTFALIQQLKVKIKIPIIAAGGIIDGKGIAAALTLGADAVQLGTAFLACEESGALPLHKTMLFSDSSNDTVLSKSHTGRMGRMIRNRISDEITPEMETLPFPLQIFLLMPLRAPALAQGKNDLMCFWSGQNTVGLKHKKAGELMKALIEEARQLIK